MPDRHVLNIYRDLRNKLLRIAEYDNFVCLLSAIEPNRETSLLALNLAAVFAFDKSRSSIVIDCDTNHNRIDELVPDADETGLIDFIENELDDVSLLIHESGIDRLRIIPSGRIIDTRTESLESMRMRDIVIELKKRYPDRYVFINAPSMQLSSEVQILSNISDQVVFELNAGEVDESQVAKAVQMIGPEKIAGIVFNGN
jgi:Mrp family chromosome partitioning ATPase